MLAGGAGLGEAAGARSLLRGIDVSSHNHLNGAAIDWAKVAAAGYAFAFVKATEGSYYVNPYYTADSTAALRAGLFVAAYHFAIPNDSSATLQADLALNAAGDQTAGGRTLPIVIDLEYDPYVSLDHTNICYGLSKAAMVTWIAAFVAEVERRTGQPPAIYTVAHWWNKCTGRSSAFSADPLWVASYGTSPTLPAGWTSWQYWQYTSTAKIPGVAGPTDVSYFSARVPAVAAPVAPSEAAGSTASLAVRSLDADAAKPLTWTASGLPPGVGIDPSTGQISGTLPTTPASYPVTVTATNAAADSQAVTFTWNVRGPVSLTRPGRQSGAAGGAVNLQVHARDGLRGCTLDFAASGLPPGLSISRCGRITGRPTRPGRYAVTIKVAGSDGQSLAATSIAWTVAAPSVLATGRLRLGIGGLCMGSPSGRTPRLRRCGASSGQTWQILSNGSIRIHGKCLAELSPTSSGPALRSCTNLVAQVWQQTQAGGLANAQSGQCLSDPAGSHLSGTAVTLSACAGVGGQAWTLPPASLAVGLGRCVYGVAAAGGSVAALHLAPCFNVRRAGQDWSVSAAGAISVPGGCLRTIGRHADAGSPVTLSTCPAAGTSAARSAKWRLMPGHAGSGSFIVNLASGLCLVVPVSPPAGTPLGLGYCQAGDPSLEWRTG